MSAGRDRRRRLQRILSARTTVSPSSENTRGTRRLPGELESDMREAAKRFEFERAASWRDTIKGLRTKNPDRVKHPTLVEFDPNFLGELSLLLIKN